ncbi:Minf_1886 family protein [Rubritalea tangerina]|uniref:Minf_1886 family protein n=2 Tax=Rubritalea tangerina TaxID=430798 RepID=A0ABW4ZAG3_9BACT
MHFEQALKNIIERDQRFSPDAYLFLKQALDHTVEEHTKTDPDMSQHVTAKELLLGFKELALKEFGPMASTLFSEWGLSQCSDIGDMVFNLIEEGMFGKQDSDKRSDFVELYAFHDAFVAPYLPKSISNKA